MSGQVDFNQVLTEIRALRTFMEASQDRLMHRMDLFEREVRCRVQELEYQCHILLYM